MMMSKKETNIIKEIEDTSNNIYKGIIKKKAPEISIRKLFVPETCSLYHYVVFLFTFYYRKEKYKQTRTFI